METITIYPSVLKGTCMPPPSKSMAHRGLICAALAKGESTIAPLEFSDDVLATIKGVKALGAKAHHGGAGKVRVFGAEYKKGHIPYIDCGESGSTLRFLLPVGASLYEQNIFTGKKSLSKRPITPFAQLFEHHGVKLSKAHKEENFILTTKGGLTGLEFALPGDISSQFISGLLLSAPTRGEKTVITLTTPLSSKNYVEMTRQVMGGFGIDTYWLNQEQVAVPGGQCYKPCHFVVERDYSQGAFFLCGGALGQGVSVTGLEPASLQGDRALLAILQKMGALYKENDKTITFTRRTQRGTEVKGDDCPDILPVLALTMALTPGTSLIRQAGRLRIKESNRFDGTIAMLKALGAHVEGLGDDIKIQGREGLKGGVVDSEGDHRMAMVAAIGALFCENPVTLTGYKAVSKSWPGFWQVYKQLGGKYSE